MQKQLLRRLSGLAVCLVGIMLMVVFSACEGVTTTGGTTTITGSITSVDAAHHSVTVNVGGSNYTVSGLSDAQIRALQAQQNKQYSFQVTQNSDGTYSLNTGSNPTQNDNATPGVGTAEPAGTSNPNEPASQGNIAFTGKVQSVSASSIVVSMPDGQALSMNIVNGQTDLSTFSGGHPTVNQTLKVKANANADGSFTATELKPTDNGDTQDQSQVDYQGVTTSAVGSDNHLHFKVGSKSFDFVITPGTTKLSDFNNNAQSIGNNQAIKVSAQFQGATATVLKVENASANH